MESSMIYTAVLPSDYRKIRTGVGSTHLACVLFLSWQKECITFFVEDIIFFIREQPASIGAPQKKKRVTIGIAAETGGVSFFPLLFS